MAKLLTNPGALVRKNLYLETRTAIYPAVPTGTDALGEWEFDIKGKDVCFPVDEYLGSWRCWEGKPTIYERNSVQFNPVYGID